MQSTRRRLLVGTALAGTLTLAGLALVRSARREVVPPHVDPAPGHYLTPDERRFVEAAVDRLVPADDLGPGGTDAGIAEFIDRQLARPFGRAERWYMEGPWAEGTEEQGYQLEWRPNELYRHAIAAVDDLCRESEGAVFADLPPEVQDRVLQELEGGGVDLGVGDSGTFFRLLIQNTREGLFADPLYDGNRGFAGWALIGFPGPRYDYTDVIGRHDDPYRLPLVGLQGRPSYGG